MFQRTRLVTALTTTLIMTLALSTIALADQTISTSGPLTNIKITTQLNCAVNHTGDSAGEFYGNTACGTFLSVGSQVFGPSSVPAGDFAGKIAWTAVSQSGVTGTGTTADPYRVVTIANAGTTGLQVTETDSYTTGQEAYRTDVAVSNGGNASQSVIVYRAGDCYLQNSDRGYGRVSGSAVACTTSETGGRIEQWFPITPGSHYYEAGYSDVWTWIGQKLPFPDTCECSTLQDNGAGLSWSLTIPAGQSLTVSHFTTFSPLGVAPLSTTKTADAATATGGAADGYTITINNPNASAATLSSITDTLPAGFSYTAGSTTGATTANPAVSSQTLTWAGPITVPASGNVTLHFRVTVATASGTYFNNATADAGAIPVAPSGPTAPIAVSGTGETPPPSTPPPSTPPPGGPATSSRAIVTATSPSCGQAVISGTFVTPGLPMQIVVTPAAGGTPVVGNVMAGADQKVSATVSVTGSGAFTAFIRNASNQVTISNTAIFTVAACAVATPSPTPTPTPTPITSPVATPKPPSSPTAAPIAVLPSTSTGEESGLPIVLAATVFALAALALRKLTSRI